MLLPRQQLASFCMTMLSVPRLPPRYNKSDEIGKPVQVNGHGYHFRKPKAPDQAIAPEKMTPAGRDLLRKKGLLKQQPIS
ncbi:hypothetical protein [Synechococcus sp. KORDI-52]|uniref:hypothetical protein n=1 Tax=Synechococcus sp. KORDI-52 TaxID=585425 RepID=UPI000AF3DF3A|nr:hypothetical protein [Synechococcus sp. KORDI-52]